MGNLLQYFELLTDIYPDFWGGVGIYCRSVSIYYFVININPTTKKKMWLMVWLYYILHFKSHFKQAQVLIK